MKKLAIALAGLSAALTAAAQPIDYTVFVPRDRDDPSRKDPSQVGDMVNEHFTVVDNPKTGALLTFWTQESWESSPDMHVAFSRSTDSGKTWTKARVLWGAPTLNDKLPNAKWQFPMVSKSGRVYCFWNQGQKPGPGMGAGDMMGASSDDDGETWTKPVRLDGLKGFWCVWQRPMRLASGNRFLTAISLCSGKQSQTCFIRFENIDDDPEVKDVRFTQLGRDRLIDGEEASLVKLPDGRLFAVLRSVFGHPLWSESRDGGETWDASKPVKDAAGKVIAHPRSPCPMYDLKGDAAGSGDVFALFCDAYNPKAVPWEARGRLFCYGGVFDPAGEQPVKFTKGDILLTRDGSSHYGNSCYSSFTCVNGQGVLWYPDEKFCLYGAKMPRAYEPLFNGRDLEGWEGATHMYVVDPSEPGVLRCDQTKIDEWKTCNLVTKREYGDFILKFECNMAKWANNGVGIRMPENVLLTEPACEAFCEIQLIDDDSSTKMKPYQHSGSVYGIVPATPGADGRYAKPCGEWTAYEICVCGPDITVKADGRVITQGDLSKFRGNGDTLDGASHPGLARRKGRIAFLGHYSDKPSEGIIVRWRNVLIKEL